MTRVNLVDPKLLIRQHLIAEYKELPRIYQLVRIAEARGDTPSDHREPIDYTLGKGHCRFFYTRLGWLVRRHEALVDEMLARGYNPQHRSPPPWTVSLQMWWYGDYEPTRVAMTISVNRINERLLGMGRSDAKIDLDTQLRSLT